MYSAFFYDAWFMRGYGSDIGYWLGANAPFSLFQRKGQHTTLHKRVGLKDKRGGALPK